MRIFWKNILISTIIIICFALLTIHLFQQVDMGQIKPDAPAFKQENTNGATSSRDTPTDQPH